MYTKLALVHGMIVQTFKHRQSELSGIVVPFTGCFVYIPSKWIENKQLLSFSRQILDYITHIICIKPSFSAGREDLIRLPDVQLELRSKLMPEVSVLARPLFCHRR